MRIRMSEPHALGVNQRLPVRGRRTGGPFVNTGVPHAVVFVEDLEAIDLRGDRRGDALSRAIRPQRHERQFRPSRSARGQLAIRTYERGVEDETLACGTGTVACALIHHCLTAIRRRSLSPCAAATRSKSGSRRQPMAGSPMSR